MANFDPYHRWLGIPPEEQPPTMYRLLELRPFESDAAAIAEAVEKRSQFLNHCLLLGSTNDIRRLIDEVDAAGRCLTNPQRKAEYDAQLRGGGGAPRPSAAAAAPTAAPQRAATDPSAKPARDKSGPQKKSAKPSAAANPPVDVIVEAAPGDSSWRTLLPIAGSAAVVLVVAVGAWLALEHFTGDASPGDGTGTAQPGQVAAIDRSPASNSTTNPGTPPGTTTTGPGGTTSPPPRSMPENPPPTDPRPTPDPQSPTDPPAATNPTPDPDPKPAPPDNGTNPPPSEPPKKPGEDGPSKPLEFVKPVLGGRVPTPKGDDLVAGEKKVAAVFGTDYAAAKRTDERAALAKKLLADADLATEDADLPARYVMLRDARMYAVDAGDAQTADAACAALAKTFEVDRHALLAESLTGIVRNAKQSDQIEALARAALDGVDAAVQDGAFESAETLLSLASGALRKVRQPELTVKAASWRTRLNESRAEFDKAEKARQVLAEKPDDPEANRAWGTYLCLVRQEWPAGLEALAGSGDPDLAKIVALEKDEPQFTPEQIALGDAWWDWIEKQPSGSAKGFRSAVRYWYKQALPGSSGLDRVKIEKRLVTIGESGPVRNWPIPSGPGGLFKS